MIKKNPAPPRRLRCLVSPLHMVAPARRPPVACPPETLTPPLSRGTLGPGEKGNSYPFLRSAASQVHIQTRDTALNDAVLAGWTRSASVVGRSGVVRAPRRRGSDATQDRAARDRNRAVRATSPRRIGLQREDADSGHSSHGLQYDIRVGERRPQAAARTRAISQLH